ncbi:MAG: pyridoxamine 5'-phosphate oxidase family protein [Beijerinckiaceae bacterium]|nr:pyridoxamine 5'-phosphate oxidase family protein [Beijerinckiaceae bacterium]
MSASHDVTTLAELDALYSPVNPTAILKEIDRIIPEYARFIEAAPFVVISTAGPEGLDCSPRGDPAGFVRILDEKTLLIPDRRGNNRVDTLRNLVRDPRIALLFMIPGIGNTMRVNGRARISADPELCASFAMRGNPATTVIAVTVESIYPQCPKALVRSRLWNPEAQIPRSALPSTGEMMRAIDPAFDAETYEAEYPARMERTIY